MYRTKLINVVNKCGKKVEAEKSEAIVGQNVHVRVLNVHIFEVQMCIFGYLKTPDIILSLVSSRKLDWTHTFDTHCKLRSEISHAILIYHSMFDRVTF